MLFAGWYGSVRAFVAPVGAVAGGFVLAAGILDQRQLGTFGLTEVRRDPVPVGRDAVRGIAPAVARRLVLRGELIAAAMRDFGVS
jgi:hypothetical protein